MKPREIRTTQDGSTTIYIPEWNENYHSHHGALQEAQHVFIKNGLHKIQKPELTIAEFGFGTGLNAFLTALEADSTQQKINYLGIEKYPINLEEVKALEYTQLIPDPEDYFGKLHRTPWNVWAPISANFKINKTQSDFRNITSENHWDLVYYDAFGYRVQPHLWSKEIFENIFQNMTVGGLLTTYCSKGVVRRTLQEIGFEVKKLKGPKGKREMINAWKK